MKSISKVPTAIKDFRILLIPRTIIFLKRNTYSFKIYVQKDMQVIGTVNELVPPMVSNIKYTFSEFNKPIQFRIVTQKKSLYKISLYQLDSSGVEHFVENSQLKISKFLEEYHAEFLQIELKLKQELKAKEASPLHEIWKSLINNFTKKSFASSVRFQTNDAIFQFIIEPVHYYDEVLREAEIIEQKKREKKNKRMEEIYNKSKTINDTIQHESSGIQLKRGYSEKQMPIIKPFSFEAKKKEEKDLKIKEDLKKFTITIHQKDSQQIIRKDFVRQNIQDDAKVSQDKREANQYKEQQQQNKQNNDITDIPEVSQGENIPNISVQHQRYLKMSEKQYGNLKKNIKIQRQQITVSNESKVGKSRRQNILLTFSLMASFIFAYILMHPLPKT